MRKTIRTTVGIGAVAALALSLGMVSTANADYAPSSTDVVGVGGDTPQYDVDFVADGDVAGDTGYNAANNVNKLVNFDATGDANGRTSYLNGSTLSAPLPGNPTVVLRAGTNPVQRPQSTTAGIAAILADTGVNHQIDYVRVGRLPKAAEQAAAAANGWGYLHVVELGTDSLEIAAATTTNAPAGLSAAELVKIYNGTYVHWNDIPGNSGGSSDAIVPLIAPTTSVINTTLLADLKTANGGTAVTLAPTVKTVEQNDPSAVTGNANPADAIVAFSSARLDLFTSGYFHTPNTVFPGGGPISAGIKLLSGTAPDGGAAYNSALVHYVVFRQTDAADAPWQPGGTKNWSQVLFSGTGTPFVKGGAGQALLAAAGITPFYADLGNVSSG